MTHKQIQEAMRRNEAELLNHLRRRERQGEPVYHLTFFSRSWMNALERLRKAGKVAYRKQRRGGGHYIARKGARPVTRLAA